MKHKMPRFPANISLACFGTSVTRERDDIRTLLFLLQEDANEITVSFKESGRTGQQYNNQHTHTHTPLVRSPLHSVFSDIIHKLLLGPSTGGTTAKKTIKIKLIKIKLKN